MAEPLPQGFEHLAPLVDEWALATQIERENKRRASSGQDLSGFYDAVFPDLEKILAACDEYPLGALPASHQPLFNLALMISEIAPHVEHYKNSPRVPFAFDETRFLAMHATQPTWQNLPPSRG